MRNEKTTPTIEELNATAANLAGEMHARFPELSIDTIRAAARFVAFAGVAGRTINQQLAPKGQELSGKGWELIFQHAAEVAVAK